MFLLCHLQLREASWIGSRYRFIRIVLREFSETANILQVGTVLNVEDAKSAINSGAKFLMSPAMVKVCILDSAVTWFLLPT
jgi:2-keto-3-deoxy-6-phosphogluconate aldolase